MVVILLNSSRVLLSLIKFRENIVPRLTLDPTLMKLNKPEDLPSEESEQDKTLSFLGKDLRPGIGNEINKSFEVSEIFKDVTQSALVDNPRDISFLINEPQLQEIPESNESNDLTKENIGIKPGKLAGAQAQFMDKILNRKREINPPILNKNIALKPKTTLKPSKSKEITSPKTGCLQPSAPSKSASHSPSTDAPKISSNPLPSHSLPKPSNSLVKSPEITQPSSIEKEMSREEERKVIQELIEQGNSIVSVSYPTHCLDHA